jgi:hypothetical protein
MVYAPVEHEARDRVDGAGFPETRPWPGDASERSRGILRNERYRDELSEPTGLILD